MAETLKGMEPLKGRPAPELVTATPVAEELRKVVERELTPENGELTATMKVRRARALENFKHHIDELYAGKEDNL